MADIIDINKFLRQKNLQGNINIEKTIKIYYRLLAVILSRRLFGFETDKMQEFLQAVKAVIEKHPECDKIIENIQLLDQVVIALTTCPGHWTNEMIQDLQNKMPDAFDVSI